MSIYSENDINFVINCPVDAKCDTPALRYMDNLRLQRLERLAAMPIIVKNELDVLRLKHKTEYQENDRVFLILYLMFAAVLLYIMFG